jgi:hypothetical protein
MTRWNFSSTGAEVVEAFKERVEGKTSKYLSHIKQERKRLTRSLKSSSQVHPQIQSEQKLL